jgi:hypothetical protein
VGKPEGKRPLIRPRRRPVDNIKMDLREIGSFYKMYPAMYRFLSLFVLSNMHRCCTCHMTHSVGHSQNLVRHWALSCIGCPFPAVLPTNIHWIALNPYNYISSCSVARRLVVAAVVYGGVSNGESIVVI